MRTRIIQITDPHLLPPGEQLMGLDVNDRLSRVLAHAAAREPDAFFLTGDFCAAEPVQDVYYRLRPLLDELAVPYYLTPGNHDDREMMRNAFFLEGHNDAPIKGLVRVADRYFLFLDSATGHIDDGQLEWLRTAVARYPYADVVMHHPPILLGVTFMDKKYPLRENGELLDILAADGRHRTVFCGHYHSHRTVTRDRLTVHLCPPTSFYINPDADRFEQQMLPPAYQILEWSLDGALRVIPTYVP